MKPFIAIKPSFTTSFLTVIALLLVIPGCKLPTFSFKAGGKNNVEIPGKTISVGYFENKAALSSSSASILFTEGLRNIMLNQSKKNLVTDNADWEIEGEIKDYRIAPVTIQAGSDVAAQNRLTMSIFVTWKYNGEVSDDDPLEIEGKHTFSAFVDYDSTREFNSIEESLLNELIRQLTQDIFDRIFGGKW
jgi:hypothetical protein